MALAPTAIRAAQTVGITSAGFVAGEPPNPMGHECQGPLTHITPGGTLCISYLYIPSLLLAPNPLIVRQWKKSFDIGKIAHPAIALVSAIAYGYLAYQMKGTLDQHKAELYGLCVLSDLMIWPWTILVMMSTNKKLFRKHDEAMAVQGSEEVTEVGLPKGESAKELVDWWSTLNVVRGCFPLVAAALGVWATVS